MKLCVASVADQEISTEHIIQDAGSTDGTCDWMIGDPRVAPFVESDGGLYDAINRGFRRARGEYLAWLNCDEQYLPAALEKVAAYFNENPETDLLLADAVVTKPDLSYICHRYGLRPIRAYMSLRFPVLSCAVFLRRRVLDRFQALFDTRWAALGDLFWMRSLMEQGIRCGELRAFTSAFVQTGANLSLGADAERESRLARETDAWWVTLFPPVALAHHRLRLLGSGVFFQKPFRYQVYTPSSPSLRVTYDVERPSAIWKWM